MNKKVIGVFLALCMLVAALPTAVFAKKTASDEIDEAIKAIKTNKNDVVVFNDMTMDEFSKKRLTIAYTMRQAKKTAASLQTYSLQAAMKHLIL